MMLYLDVKYLKQVSYRLERFKVQKDTGNTFQSNCRCPICGDSQTNTKKARGYFYSASNHLLYKCHNCNVSLPFGQFLKQLDYNAWQEYRLEQFKHNQELNPTPVKVYEKISYNPRLLNGLQRVDLLNDDHPARTYIRNRKIPKEHWKLFYYADKFYEWANTNTDKFKDMHTPDHPRIIMPWYSADGNIFAYQARAMGNETPKYYSIVLDKSVPRVYGLDRVDWSKPIYCLEGPIDSLFIPNAVAVGTSALYMFETDKQEVIYVSDNENRNKEILKVYNKLIKLGKNVFIPPDNYQWKDINDSVLNNFDIISCINDNVYNGLRAISRLSEWKKVDYE